MKHRATLTVRSFFPSLGLLLSSACRVPTSRHWGYRIHQIGSVLTTCRAPTSHPPGHPRRAQRKEGEGAKRMRHWKCDSGAASVWAGFHSVVPSSFRVTVASDPTQSAPFYLFFNKGISLHLLSVFSFYGQKYLRSPRTFLVKPRTSRV